MKKKESVVSVNTRYPDDVHEFIKNEAASQERSFNAQVIWIIRQQMKQRQKIDKKTTKSTEE